MNKLALMMASAIALTMPAYAATPYDQSRDSYSSATTAAAAKSPGSDYVVKEHALPNGGVEVVRTEYTTKMMAKPVSSMSPDADYTGTYNLVNGQKLQVNGVSAQLITSGGMKFYAPNASYVTTDGLTFFTESGKVLRMEAPPQMVYLDTSKMGR